MSIGRLLKGPVLSFRLSGILYEAASGSLPEGANAILLFVLYILRPIWVKFGTCYVLKIPLGFWELHENLSKSGTLLEVVNETLSFIICIFLFDLGKIQYMLCPEDLKELF